LFKLKFIFDKVNLSKYQRNIMSRQEKTEYIEQIRNLLQSYNGFTQIEKNYAHLHLPTWIEAKHEFDTFIHKFAEKFSLDIRPFLLEKELLKQET